MESSQGRFEAIKRLTEPGPLIETTMHKHSNARPLEFLFILPLLVVGLWISATGCDSASEGDVASSVSRAIPDDEALPYDLTARQDAFRLFYRERLLRILTAYNRFAMVGDVVAATSLGKMAVARQGNEFEVVPGPNDNNPIGIGAFLAYHAYQVFGGRELELTLIRFFEGLAFMEAVSGHPGLTEREALPGWTLTVDGVTGEALRTRNGVPVIPPQTWPRSLEQEILATFFKNVIFVYRDNPGEYYFTFKPVDELEAYAITWVFSEPDRFLGISDCCSSWMITKKGPWTGAYWGNHNSRDNFPDLTLGYLAAMACARNPEVPEDLRLAAVHAEEAGRRVGDLIFEHGGALMTVGERGSYEDLVPAGEVRPDGETEWQDLGSMATCQMDYLARALSSEGLDLPLPALPLPGALEKMFLEQLMRDLGCELPLPEFTCQDMDAALIGLGWGDILDVELFGMPWYEFLKELGENDPNLIPSLFGSMMDDFHELQLAQVATCYYARIFEKPDLYEMALQTLSNLIEMQRVFAFLLDEGLSSGIAAGTRSSIKSDVSEMLYNAAVFSRMFGLEAPDEDLDGFSRGEQQNRWIESQLTRADTQPWALISQDEINQRIQTRLQTRESWIQERYRAHFTADEPPVRRTEDGYEALVDMDQGTWAPVENPRHEWFGAYRLLFEIPLCVDDPDTLDCTWAAAGCARADLNRDGVTDGTDLEQFNEAWTRYGPGGTGEGTLCTVGNDWCHGGDLTRGGRLNQEDMDFMHAAQGCTL